MLIHPKIIYHWHEMSARSRSPSPNMVSNNPHLRSPSGSHYEYTPELTPTYNIERTVPLDALEMYPYPRQPSIDGMPTSPVYVSDGMDATDDVDATNATTNSSNSSNSSNHANALTRKTTLAVGDSFDSIDIAPQAPLKQKRNKTISCRTNYTPSAKTLKQEQRKQAKLVRTQSTERKKEERALHQRMTTFAKKQKLKSPSSASNSSSTSDNNTGMGDTTINNTSMFETSADTIMTSEHIMPVFGVGNAGVPASEELDGATIDLHAEIGALKSLVDHLKDTEKQQQALIKKMEKAKVAAAKLNSSKTLENQKTNESLVASVRSEKDVIVKESAIEVAEMKKNVDALQTKLVNIQTKQRRNRSEMETILKTNEDVKEALNEFLYAKMAKHSYHNAAQICPISLEYLLPDDNVLALNGCACNFIMKVENATMIMKEFFAADGKIKCPTCSVMCHEMKFMTVSQACQEVEWKKIERYTNCHTREEVIARYYAKTLEDSTNKTTQDTAHVRSSNDIALQELQGAVKSFAAKCSGAVVA